MAPSLLLLLLLLLLRELDGWGSADSRPEVLQAPAGASIQVQCHYRLQDIRARKVWCRFSPEGCRPLVSSAVDRSVPGSGRTFLTDMGGGLLQVEMVTLQEEDSGQYGCLVEGAAGPHLVHTFALEVRPEARGPGEEEEEARKEEEEEENYGVGPPAEDSTGPWGLSQREKRPSPPVLHPGVPLAWGVALLLGLLLLAVVLVAVMATRKGNRSGVRGLFQRGGVSGTDLSSAAHHAGDPGPEAAVPSDVPYTKLNLPPSFDNTTSTHLAFEPPSGKAPAPSSPPPLPLKAVASSKLVTYATVLFPGGDKGGGASSEPTQDPPPSSPSPLS